jgi:hypothetical protein
VTGSHPARCKGCRGSGWADGPPIVEVIDGQQHVYATVEPCEHDWWHDDTSWDPYYDEPLDRGHPRAQAAFARGYAEGIAELDAMRPRPKETP